MNNNELIILLSSSLFDHDHGHLSRPWRPVQIFLSLPYPSRQAVTQLTPKESLPDLPQPLNQLVLPNQLVPSNEPLHVDDLFAPYQVCMPDHPTPLTRAMWSHRHQNWKRSPEQKSCEVVVWAGGWEFGRSSPGIETVGIVESLKEERLARMPLPSTDIDSQGLAGSKAGDCTSARLHSYRGRLATVRRSQLSGSQPRGRPDRRRQRLPPTTTCRAAAVLPERGLPPSGRLG